MSNKNTNLLLVEDDPAFINLIRRILKSYESPLNLIAFENGRDLISAIKQKTLDFEIGLIDLGLPDFSGIELIKLLSEKFPAAPLMVLSVISSESSLLNSIQAGARGYILKDDSEYSIRQSIEQVLKGNYPISPMIARHLFKLAKAQASKNLPLNIDSPLTKTELIVLEKISKGLSYQEIANKLETSISTIQSHIRNMYKKLDVHSKTQAIDRAREVGYLQT